ncbi:signal peptidase I [Polaribacter sp. MSW13]|uniref:Signal peptidase I n=2 Tax=Polaribacter marinus TaxID=2916838 RepID=A0A9X1VS01_9FLAO|nr:signal peptidase I [Polaribacter marinus]
MATPANEPNMSIGSKTLATNLISPNVGDFICYNFEDTFLGNHVRVHRLVAAEFDTIKIINGVVFVNNINIDENRNLVHLYKTEKENLNKIKESKFDFDNLAFQRLDSVNFKLLLEDFMVDKLDFNVTRLIEDSRFIDNDIQTIYNKAWNKDNFGPIVVPKNKVFVLGDSRDATFDSRNIGFIDKEKITGVIFIII